MAHGRVWEGQQGAAEGSRGRKDGAAAAGSVQCSALLHVTTGSRRWCSARWPTGWERHFRSQAPRSHPHPPCTNFAGHYLMTPDPQTYPLYTYLLSELNK